MVKAPVTLNVAILSSGASPVAISSTGVSHFIHWCWPQSGTTQPVQWYMYHNKLRWKNLITLGRYHAIFSECFYITIVFTYHFFQSLLFWTTNEQYAFTNIGLICLHRVVPNAVLPRSSLRRASAPFCSSTFTASKARLEAAMCSDEPLSNSEHTLSISKETSQKYRHSEERCISH